MQDHETVHRAPLIASDADVETLETYEDRIHHYENLNYTYIPMPRDRKYYNTKEGWVREINDSQYISPQTHLLQVLKSLQQQPFLLVDADHNKFVIVRDSDSKPLFVRSEKDVHERISPDEFKKQIDFDHFEFGWDDVTVYSLDEFLASDMRLEDKQQALITSYDERFQIITLADVNSRRMKDMLYQRLADLAAGLGQKIEEEYPQPDSIFKYINPNAIGRWKKDQIRGLNLHIAEHLTLIDMMKVIQSSEKEFVKSCGFESKNDVGVLNSINNVRNSVMHANRSLIHNRQDIANVLEAIENAERIVSDMNGSYAN